MQDHCGGYTLKSFKKKQSEMRSINKPQLGKAGNQLGKDGNLWSSTWNGRQKQVKTDSLSSQNWKFKRSRPALATVVKSDN